MEFFRQHVRILFRAQHSAVNGDHRKTKLLCAGLRQLFAGPQCRRRLQAASGRIGRVLQSVIVTVNADQHLDLVVIRRDVLVVHRPVEPEPVATARLEIVRPIA
jgi:hypothetical protein